jgi:hypothetical protein
VEVPTSAIVRPATQVGPLAGSDQGSVASTPSGDDDALSGPRGTQENAQDPAREPTAPRGVTPSARHKSGCCRSAGEVVSQPPVALGTSPLGTRSARSSAVSPSAAATASWVRARSASSCVVGRDARAPASVARAPTASTRRDRSPRRRRSPSQRGPPSAIARPRSTASVPVATVPRRSAAGDTKSCGCRPTSSQSSIDTSWVASSCSRLSQGHVSWVGSTLPRSCLWGSPRHDDELLGELGPRNQRGPSSDA